MSSVRDLIKALEQLDPDLEVIIEPGLTGLISNTAYLVLRNKVAAIELRVDEAQSNRDLGDKCSEDYIEYDFNRWIDVVDKKKVVIISNEYLSYSKKDIIKV